MCEIWVHKFPLGCYFLLLASIMRGTSHRIPVLWCFSFSSKIVIKIHLKQMNYEEYISEFVFDWTAIAIHLNPEQRIQNTIKSQTVKISLFEANPLYFFSVLSLPLAATVSLQLHIVWRLLYILFIQLDMPKLLANEIIVTLKHCPLKYLPHLGRNPRPIPSLSCHLNIKRNNSIYCHMWKDITSKTQFTFGIYL